MTPFGSQNDTSKKTASTAVPVDTKILVPSQDPQKSTQKQPPKRDLSWLIPPQEEMIDVARARGEKARIDSAVDRLEEQINKHQFEYTPPRTVHEIAEEQALRGAVFTGFAGVTVGCSGSPALGCHDWQLYTELPPPAPYTSIPRSRPLHAGQSKPKDTKPKDRIKHWNIVPGDFVKIRGDTNGPVHEVHRVNKLSNRVILKREINKAGYVPEAGRQSEFLPYSQCQLLLGKYEYPLEGDETEPKLKNVFATRLATSASYYRKGAYWIWRRYAVNTTPRLPNYTAKTHVSIRIPWPKRNPVTKPEPHMLTVSIATAYDTTEDAVLEVTYTPPTLPDSFLQHPASRIPSEQGYITSLVDPTRMFFSASAPIEVHLKKKLSNPHSRAKKQARWQTFQEHQKNLLQEYIDAEYANLGGRTKQIARADATWKWQQRLLKDRRAELSRRWRNRGAEVRLHQKRERKARKLEKREEKPRTLVLAEVKNQILPRAA